MFYERDMIIILPSKREYGRSGMRQPCFPQSRHHSANCKQKIQTSNQKNTQNKQKTFKMICLSKSLKPVCHYLKTRVMMDMNHGQFLFHLFIKASETFSLEPFRFFQLFTVAQRQSRHFSHGGQNESLCLAALVNLLRKMTAAVKVRVIT